MNKVYKISATTLILVAALGISSCSTYQPSGYESDGVYYNPKTDKTYQVCKYLPNRLYGQYTHQANSCAYK